MYRTFYSIQQVSIVLCLASLFHLVIISVERFVAMKYSLRYQTIVNKFRITVAVACCWLIAIACYVLQMFSALTLKWPAYILSVISLLVIIYCHISVYFVCRRHTIQIRSEQVSQQATAEFLEEKKAWKTTGIIIGGIFVCYLSAFLIPLVSIIFPYIEIKHVRFSCFLLNSLLNPIIYCWRSTTIREAMMQVLKKQGN